MRAFRLQIMLPCLRFMRNDAKFPNTEGGAQGGCGRAGGMKRGEGGKRVVKVVDGFLQFVIAAPCVDQKKAKAGGTFVQDSEPCDVIGQANGIIRQGRQCL